MTEPIVKQIHKLLIKNKKTIAVAESCTGGLLAGLLTETSGSSKYFILGVVAYSNSAKKGLLGIPASIMEKYGAVSENTANLMAQNVKRIAKANFGIGITGIAGPSGGTNETPVGTVFIAINSHNKQICRRFYFTGSRTAIRKKAALQALKLLR